MNKIKLKSIVVLDLEMCCWEDRPSGEIIEIGVAEIDVETLTVKRTAQYYVKPEKDEVSEYCTNLTGITSTMVKKQGRPLAEVLSSLNKTFGKNKVYTAWGRDDLTLMNEASSKNISFFLPEFLNFSNLFRTVHNLDRISQKQALEMYNVEYDSEQLHSGAYDALTLAQLIIEFYKKVR